MGFIKDFYCNRLDPQRRYTPPDGEVMRRSRELSDKEAELLGMLPEKEKKLFIEIMDAWQDILADNSLDRFIIGFQCGARFAYDTFVGAGALNSEQRRVGKIQNRSFQNANFCTIIGHEEFLLILFGAVFFRG